MKIGDSIQEAIDWTQDRLATTRPLAERTLFSLLVEHAVEETDDGFILIEAEDELEKHHKRVKSNITKNWKRLRFHSKRKHAKHKQRQKLRHFDNADTAEDMLFPDEDEA